MRPRVLDAQLVSAKAMKVKLPAFHVARVNLITLLVQWHANRVQRRRTLVKKEETAVAQLAPRDGRPLLAVQHAKRAVRGRSARVANIAHWDLQEKETTLMRRNADNVHWGKQRCLKVQLRAVGVI